LTDICTFLKTIEPNNAKDFNMETSSQTIYLKDYEKTPYAIDHVELKLDLHDQWTDVIAKHLVFRREGVSDDAPLILDGIGLHLQKVFVNDREVAIDKVLVSNNKMTLHGLPARFTLEVRNRIFPHLNTALEGLYISKDIYATQCEAEGFRRITYFYDRPDVMATYKVTICADKRRYPVLLSNGNCVDSGELPEGRHFSTWEDPFKKPCYLFALVAGNLAVLKDSFRTRSGRTVELGIYADERDISKCDYAMRSLKQAMQWDEESYGRECDLDVYNIVSVRDFNMGAMENKGLNIFNAARILASPKTSTDAEFRDIAAVIGHEYFHNWTGNRVTCRDWFQLCLKEGLTVFRDSEFMEWLYSKPVTRLDRVQDLRTRQFPEDDGPMVHAPRPDSFVEINNFYTTTIYEKGAEVVRMLKTLIGESNFRKGMDLYFERHDGQAVTQEDFVQAMADASGVDLTQFMLWYTQPGAPHVEASGEWNKDLATYTLHVTQQVPGNGKKPLHIPMRVTLYDSSGNAMPLVLRGQTRLSNSSDCSEKECCLELKAEKSSFTFERVTERPIPSLFRGFAPIRLKSNLTNDDYVFLMKHDTDPVNAWNAAQSLLTRELVRMTQNIVAGEKPELENALQDAFAYLLEHGPDDRALKARMLALPSFEMVAQQLETLHPEAIFAARNFMRESFAKHNRDALLKLYTENREPTETEPAFDAAHAGKRQLKNMCLHLLCALKDAGAKELVVQAYHGAKTMTDSLAALVELSNWELPERVLALDDFYGRWKDEDLVLDRWFAVQALSSLPGTLECVKMLTQHKDFHKLNPNRLRSLVMQFCKNNALHFHNLDGSGYAFCSEWVKAIDGYNRQIAANLVRAFGQWRKLEPVRSDRMRRELMGLKATEGLSRDVAELVEQMLR
jgi:aminopeptidase N